MTLEVTAQNIVIIRDKPGGHMLRYMAGGEVEFEPGHLCSAVNQSFDESLKHHRKISELAKTQVVKHD